MVIFRARRKVMMVEQVAGIWTIVARKSLPSNNVVKFRQKAFLVLPESPAYVSRKFITYYLTTNGQQLSFFQMDLKQQGELVEDIFCKQIVRQLSSSLNTSGINLTTLLYVLLGAIAALPVGMVLGPVLGINIG